MKTNTELHSEYFPTYSEFKEEIETVFHKDEIVFVTQMALKDGFKNFDSFLKFIYRSQTESFDLKNITKEFFISPLEKGAEINGSILSIAFKNKNKRFEKELDKTILNANKNPEGNEPQDGAIVFKILITFFKLILDKIKHDKNDLKLGNEILKGIVSQTKFDYPLTTNPYESVLEYFESYQLPSLNALLVSAVNPNFYFNDKRGIILKLHDLLVENNYMEQHADFEKLFENEVPDPNKVKMAVWKNKPQTHLFYLLYKLNNSQFDYKHLHIVEIAFYLFEFGKETKLNSLKTNFNKVFRKFNDNNFLSNYMNEMVKIVDILAL